MGYLCLVILSRDWANATIMVVLFRARSATPTSFCGQSLTMCEGTPSINPRQRAHISK